MPRNSNKSKNQNTLSTLILDNDKLLVTQRLELKGGRLTKGIS